MSAKEYYKSQQSLIRRSRWHTVDKSTRLYVKRIMRPRCAAILANVHAEIAEARQTLRNAHEYLDTIAPNARLAA